MAATTVAREFEALMKIEKESQHETICWVNDIAYKDRKLNVLEYTREIEDEKKQLYTFITNFSVTKKNAKRLVKAGRSRWKIENEGFNNQKNVRYHIEHANSHNYMAMKNYYLLTQIADILMQLYENGLGLLKKVKKTAKEISSNLLEAIRTRKITDEDIYNLAKRIQIHFT